MKKIVFNIALFISVNVCAQSLDFQRAKIENLNIDYSNDRGLASFGSLLAVSEDLDLDLENYDINFQKSGRDFFIQTADSNYVLRDVESELLQSATVLKLNNGNLDIIPGEKTSASFSSTQFELGNGIQSFGRTRINCKSQRVDPSDTSLIKPCFKLGSFSTPVINLSQFSRKTIEKAFSSKKFSKSIAAPTKLEDINLNISNNNFTLTLKTKLDFNIKLKMSGNAFYQEDRERIVFVVRKAKAGFLNVKKTLLNEIRNANIKNVAVIGDNIIINL